MYGVEFGSHDVDAEVALIKFSKIVGAGARAHCDLLPSR